MLLVDKGLAHGTNFCSFSGRGNTQGVVPRRLGIVACNFPQFGSIGDGAMHGYSVTKNLPNVTGLSLVLYLFVAILSIFAASGGSGNSEDFRNSLGQTSHSAQVTPHKPGGDDAAIIALPLDGDLRVYAEETEQAGPQGSLLPRGTGPRSFQARGPPAQAESSAG